MSRAFALTLLLFAACPKDEPQKMTMPAQQVIDIVSDYAERGCACETDKECFRAVRDEWDANKKDLVFNAKLMTGDDKAAYDAVRRRFGMCGDGAGLAVWDRY